MRSYYTLMPSPVGTLVLTSDGAAITGLYMPQHRCYAQAQQGTEDATPFRPALMQLNEYFHSGRVHFDVPVSAQGTAFQQRVWGALRAIPLGETRSYKQLAESIGVANAYRAVGLANSNNPVSLIIPCHRVVGASGKLTGYAGGLAAKEWLIKHERGWRLQ